MKLNKLAYNLPSLILFIFVCYCHSNAQRNTFIYCLTQMHFYIQIWHNSALKSVCLRYLCKDSAARSTSSHWSADYRTTQTAKRGWRQIYILQCAPLISRNLYDWQFSYAPTGVDSPSARSSLILEGWRMWRRGHVWEAKLQPATTWHITQCYTCTENVEKNLCMVESMKSRCRPVVVWCFLANKAWVVGVSKVSHIRVLLTCNT